MTTIYKLGFLIHIMIKKKIKKHFFKMTDEDFSRENLIEGGLIRPVILMTSFFTFLLAMFLLLMRNYKWGGSLIVFSFVFTLYSIYQSLKDKSSIFKRMNLAFKFILFLFEIVIFIGFFKF